MTNATRKKSIIRDFHHGFNHYLVDTGETELDHYKQTPILINSCDQHNLTTIAGEFLAASKNISIGLSDFICGRLMAHPTIPVKHGATRTGHSRTR